MIVLKHILVATDFGPAADAALTYGRALAATSARRCTCCTSRKTSSCGRPPPIRTLLKAAVARRLEERLTDEDRSALHARAVLETSDQPADAIIDYAKQADIDLIVDGHARSHRHVAAAGRQRGRARRANRALSRPDRQASRSTNSSFPTMLAPGRSEAVMIALKKILVATDFSEPSDAALAYGRELARTFGAYAAPCCTSSTTS